MCTKDMRNGLSLTRVAKCAARLDIKQVHARNTVGIYMRDQAGTK